MALAEAGVYRNVIYYRAKSDVNGNPRYVVHFLSIPFRDQLPGEDYTTYQNAHLAHARNALCGKHYRGSDFGGGIVVQTDDIRGQIDHALAKIVTGTWSDEFGRWHARAEDELTARRAIRDEINAWQDNQITVRSVQVEPAPLYGENVWQEKY